MQSLWEQQGGIRQQGSQRPTIINLYTSHNIIIIIIISVDLVLNIILYGTSGSGFSDIVLVVMAEGNLLRNV